jgi:cytochrome c peroxidase
MNARRFRATLADVSATVALFAVSLLIAADGDIITTPDASDGIEPAFTFRTDVPFQSLKDVPIWSELQQMLDDPYATAACARDATANGQGYPARCTAIQRRRAFLPAGCTYDPSTGLPPCDDSRLQQFLVHPLNYNPVTGEQSRLLAPGFAGVGNFANLGAISSGASRMQPGDAPAIDYNSPLVADGGDPGEPSGYSGAAVCGDDPISGWVENRPACSGNAGKLFDPTVDVVTMQPRGIITSLEKPSIGQAYAVNSEAALAGHPEDLAPSNPDDYVQDRQMAMVLGKALFWDMQLGSDGVQACGTCHFAAGADTRTRDQLNPNTLGGDNALEVFRNRHLGTPPVAADQDANRDLVPSDFPTHRLQNQAIAGEPLLNPSNVLRDSNDVVSSMGMRLRVFNDIRVIGSSGFSAASNGVRALLPDSGSDVTDPIPLYQGLRRVEPRNTPSMINAAFSFDNFWDGRARHDFNGGSVFGASDPQSHVLVDMGAGLQKTRQIVRFASAASQMTGPALSEFEMSFRGRSWPKIGKKLLQGLGTASRPNVTPLAAQLVSTSDSVLGPFSNQGGSWCLDNGRSTAAGRPGLCLSYRDIVQQAFFPQLWANTSQHLTGAKRPCTNIGVPTDADGASNGVVTPTGCDPFDGFILRIDAGAAGATNRNQFTQMEANFVLFGGLGLQAWLETLVSDDTPFDRFLDRNPRAFAGLNGSIPLCTQTSPANQQPCLTETEGFVRPRPPAGTPDRLLGMDLFFGSNLSNRNPNFRNARCGGCHSGGTLTDQTFVASDRLTMTDFIPEFLTPGSTLPRRPLGRPRQVSGFLLEAQVNGNSQGSIRRSPLNQPAVPDSSGTSPPVGAGFIDNGMYNVAVRPIDEDILRGGTDAWGWPLSVATLMLKNLGGASVVPGTALPNFDPSGDAGCAPDCVTGGLFARTAQDRKINPGFSGRPLSPKLPALLAPWINPITLGKTHPEVGEVAGGLNTLTEVPLLDGYLDILGPFNPNATLNQQTNAAMSWLMGTWPKVNRVGRAGNAKAPSLRNVELTGPYFHNGGKLTLRQVVNFYAHGGDFPVTNATHKDFNIVHLDTDGESRLTAADRVALVDFLLSLTDERVAHEQAPFDRPELFLPVDGRAPDNTLGRNDLLAKSSAASVCGSTPCFSHLAAVGAEGHPERLPAFLNVARTVTAGSNNDHFDQ